MKKKTLNYYYIVVCMCI